MVLSDKALLLKDKFRLVFAQIRRKETRVEILRAIAYKRSVRMTATPLYLATLAAVLAVMLLAWLILREQRRTKSAVGLLALIVESSDDGIVSKDMLGIVTSWNSGAERIFGYSAEEMIGQPISVLSPPDLKNEMMDILEQIGRGERVDHFRSVRRTKAGKDLQVSITVSPIRDESGRIVGASKIVRDITAQAVAEKEVARQRERLNVTLRSIGDAVIAADTAGRVDYLNPVAENLTGWSSEEAMGRPLEEVLRIINEETRKPAENPVAKVLREGKVVGLANHTVLISRQGTEIAIDDSAAPIRDDRGELTGVVLVFHDASVERRSQDMLRKAEKLAAAARLSASVAHEINNPLAAIMYLIFTAKTAPDAPPAVVQHLALAEQEIERVAHVTRKVLGFYRGSKVPERIEIRSLIESALGLYAGKLEAKNIRVTRALEDCPPVEGAHGEINQAISNLIANAIDAVKPNGEIVVSTCRSAADKKRAVEISVADSGPGIAEENVNRIFEPFFTTKKDTGTGLGLWITKEIIERHGGTISVKPKGNGDWPPGAAFTIELPCAGEDPK